MRIPVFCLFLSFLSQSGSSSLPSCSNLLLGQYLCDPVTIDPATQQPLNCTRENRAKVLCRVADGVECNDTTKSGKNSTFYREIACKWTNGYRYDTALLLSIFLGMFGIDRFYLGYPAIGLLKLSTLGFFFIGQLVDILLIALQIVQPSDGSYFVVDYYGPRLFPVTLNNETYFKPAVY